MPIAKSVKSQVRSTESSHIVNTTIRLSHNAVRHALTVINGLEGKFSGTITRERKTIDNLEKSVIDFIITSSDLVKMLIKCILMKQG